jgi:uncharacterized protein (TIGR03382 family)
VMATAIDSSGNTASCTFIVQVIYDGIDDDDDEPEGGCSANKRGSTGTLVFALLALACSRSRRARCRVTGIPIPCASGDAAGR